MYKQDSVINFKFNNKSIHSNTKTNNTRLIYLIMICCTWDDEKKQRVSS